MDACSIVREILYHVSDKYFSSGYGLIRKDTWDRDIRIVEKKLKPLKWTKESLNVIPIHIYGPPPQLKKSKNIQKNIEKTYLNKFYDYNENIIPEINNYDIKYEKSLENIIKENFKFKNMIF